MKIMNTIVALGLGLVLLAGTSYAGPHRRINNRRVKRNVSITKKAVSIHNEIGAGHARAHAAVSRTATSKRRVSNRVANRAHRAVNRRKK